MIRPPKRNATQPRGGDRAAFYALFALAAALCLAIAVAGCAAPAPAATAQTTSAVTVGASTTSTGIAPTTASITDTTSTAGSAATTGATTATGAAATAGSALFDSSKIHELSVSFSQDDYDAMIETFKTSGSKDWIEATVTIDGVTFNRVGMRLKGNSSIMGLRNGGTGRGPSANVSVDKPESLPWLIRLDKNIDGQSYDGMTDLVVRSNTSSTSLNEAVALDLLDMAGLASVRSVDCRFAVNGGSEIIRLVTELPDDQWMQEHFASGGALYKAEASGDYSYRGSDPSAYENIFDQEAGKKNADLTPLIKFLDFINNSDDSTFNSELPKRLDVDAFATYLAMEDLIGNFDDIDGPGNNSYLYYDPATSMFAIVPWDHNLAFGAMGNRGGNGQGTTQNGGQVGATGAQFTAVEDVQTGGQVAAAGQGGRQPGQQMTARGKSNILVTRFHKNAEFEALYQQKLTDLRAKLYASGDAQKVLDTWVQLLKTQAPDLLTAATINQDAAKISAYFTPAG